MFAALASRTRQIYRTVQSRVARSLATAPAAVVFDRDVKRMQKNTAARAPNSKEFDFLRDYIADNVTDRFNVLTTLWLLCN